MTAYTPNHVPKMRRIVSALRKGQAAATNIRVTPQTNTQPGSEPLDTASPLPSPIESTAPTAGNTRYRKKIEQQIRQMREAINAKEWDTARIHSEAITGILELLEKNPGRAAQRRTCGCGSGLDSEWTYDGRGIPLSKCCVKCKSEKLSKFRPEVLSDPDYEADEPSDPEEY